MPMLTGGIRAWVVGAVLLLHALSQSTLGGTVTAAGAPVAGVRVRVFPVGEAVPAATAQTDDKGVYRVEVPRGVYRVEFVHEKYETVTRLGVVVLADAANDLSVALKPSSQAAAPRVSELRPGEIPVRIETPLGVIVIAVDSVRAPVTTANFLRYVDAGLYDGGRFHRATRPDNYTPAPPNRPAMEIIQGGINPDRATNGYEPIRLERTSETGLVHIAGTVSMARGNEADTARSDFFILLDDQPSLDFGGKRFDDGQGAAAFGRVLSGLDVVRKIQQQPVTGQNLTPPVPIVKVVRSK
jgi:peptidyl-prolyl cis-trans isomerase A (cyclophilin A)